MDGIIILHPILIANICIYLYDHQYFQRFILFIEQVCFTFMLFLVFIGSISYDSCRRKQIYVHNVLIEQCANDTVDVIEQEQQVSTVSEDIVNSPIDDCCEPVILSNDCIFDETNFTTKLPRQLICYCDGSYSHRNQIGYSGFRASNGFSKYRSCPLRRPHSGSTESEVFAACLALRYTAKYHYNRLILYTDNSKVVQLLKRPKKQDYYNYATFFQALEQCYERHDDFDIQVEHVRGHPTWYEQKQCLTKREFAKVDRQVRRERQRYEYKYNSTYKINDPSVIAYSYRYGEKYIRWIHPEKFGATLIITSS